MCYNCHNSMKVGIIVLLRKPRHRNIADRLWFKIAGIACTLVVFAISFMYLEVWSDKGLGDTIGLLIPVAMVLICEAIKQRQLWWLWLIGAAVCFAGMMFLPSLAVYAYWVFSLVICVVQFSISSRSRFRFRMEAQPEEVMDTVPYKKDDYLEALLDKK